MKYFLLFYEAGADYAERRQPYRTEHLQYGMAAVERGELILGGAYGDQVDGAVLVCLSERLPLSLKRLRKTILTL